MLTSKCNDLTGRTFGLLTVLSEAGRQRGEVLWLCTCDCGNQHTVISSKLKSGEISSCGCIRRERARRLNYKHGLTHTYAMHAWQSMIQRCYNPDNANFFRYGGRGIKVCEFLRSSVEGLIQIIGERPTPLHSVDRMDNENHYSCGQCAECLKCGFSLNIRWADKKTQARNSRTNAMVTIDGITKTVAQWIEETGIPRTSFLRRHKIHKRHANL